MIRLKRMVLISWMLLAAFHGGAQKTKKEKQAKEKEEVEMPPPPMEELKEVVIDTAGNGSLQTGTKAFTRADFFFSMPDTSAAPADELTSEIKKFLKMTGAFDLGIQFAKLMNSEDDAERNGLPKEFYKRMYDEFSGGETRRIFENELVKLYRKHFSLAEMKDVTRFYETETGGKLIQKMPLLLEESQKMGAEIGKVLGMKIYNDLLKDGIIK